MTATIHASAVLADGRGVLVRGPSGSGKSSLVLALLIADRARSRLVADDRVRIAVEDGRLFAAPPQEIAGLLEVRGQGILCPPHVFRAEIALVVDLEPAESLSRMPPAEERIARLEGIVLPRLALPAGAADGWIRVLAALAFPPLQVQNR